MTTEPYESTGLDAFVSDEVKARIAVARGVTVSSAAEALNIRRATLSARVNGRARFSPSQLDKVSRLLGTTASDVVAAAERRRSRASGDGQMAPDAQAQSEALR